MRGTFGNIRLRNQLAEDARVPTRATCPRASRRSSTTRRCATATRACRSSSSRAASTGRVVARLGREGAELLGIRAVIAESYERIHRSNLVGMGVLPLQFLPGENAASLGLTGREAYTIHGLADIGPRQQVDVAVRSDGDGGAERRFGAIAPARRTDRGRLPAQGGILPAVLRRLARDDERDRPRDGAKPPVTRGLADQDPRRRGEEAAPREEAVNLRRRPARCNALGPCGAGCIAPIVPRRRRDERAGHRNRARRPCTVGVTMVGDTGLEPVTSRM